MKREDKLFLGLAIMWLIMALWIYPAHASITVKEVRGVYKLLCKTNNLKCPPLYITGNSDVNAHTSLTRINLDAGSLLYLNQAEIALLLGHELTHYQFRDVLAPQYGNKFIEDRADSYGTAFASNLGYSKCAQAGLFLVWFRMYGNNGGKNDPHSSNLIRYHRLCH